MTSDARDDADHDGSIDIDAEVYFRIQTSMDAVEVRQRLNVVSDDARFTVDEGVTFEFPGPIEVDQSIRQDFISKVGLMVLHPFMRESLRSLSAKLGVEPVLLPIRRGFDLEPMDPSEASLKLPNGNSED
ncbi:hypothetical protein [Pseudarthrobacter sp. CCNWLW207]|uniref:hypothetical protein n=1 Tax=Pseudarthrobacter sp. CCNWLW207 TaxID=3127468 RepID=UPI0030779CF0